MKKLAILIFFAISIVSTAAMAQAVEHDKMYAGGGISSNSLPRHDSATGFQLFGGYQLDTVDVRPFLLAVEIGYMNTGRFDRNGVDGVSAKGLWSAAVFSLPLTNWTDLLLRGGIDFGDDDGLLVGVGVDFALDRRTSLRAEYVDRDAVGSLQGNFVFRF